jgi:hypothetical protein
MKDPEPIDNNGPTPVTYGQANGPAHNKSYAPEPVSAPYLPHSGK